MLRYAQIIADHAEELGKVEAQDTGKAWSVALADQGATSRYFEFYGAAAGEMHGETIPFQHGYFVPSCMNRTA